MISGIPPLNQRLVECAYDDVSDGDITLEEYEERLDYYFSDESPPKRVHYKDMMKQAETFAMDDDIFTLVGIRFERVEGTPWFERVDRNEG